MIDRRHPVDREALFRFLRFVAQNVVAVRLDLQERAAGAVAFGDEDLVADDDRIRRVDAFDVLGAEGKMEVNLAALRFERQQTAAREDETIAPIVDRRQDRARVAREFVADLIDDLAGQLVERDDAGAVGLERLIEEIARVAAGRTAADLCDQQVAFNDGRAADAEEILDDVEILVDVDAPDELSGVGFQAMQQASDAISVSYCRRDREQRGPLL